MISFILKTITSCIYIILFKIKFFRSMSQEGEDLIIDRLIQINNIDYKDIYYLDIGAGHPIKYSNTFYFYLRGSHGITVDALKNNINLHKLLRPRDISKNYLIGDKNEIVDFYLYKESELNTSSKFRKKELEEYSIFSQSKQKLKKISINNFIKNEIKDDLNKINFLNIDVEGSDLEIIKSIDWENFQPNIISVEILSKHIEEINGSEIYKILKSNGYSMNSKLINSVIFTKNLK